MMHRHRNGSRQRSFPYWFEYERTVSRGGPGTCASQLVEREREVADGLSIEHGYFAHCIESKRDILLQLVPQVPKLLGQASSLVKNYTSVAYIS